MQLKKKDGTHNSYFERVILIYVTKIHCRTQIIGQATLVFRMGMLHADYMRRLNKIMKNVILLKLKLHIIIFARNNIMVTYVTDCNRPMLKRTQSNHRLLEETSIVL